MCPVLSFLSPRYKVSTISLHADFTLSFVFERLPACFCVLSFLFFHSDRAGFQQRHTSHNREGRERQREREGRISSNNKKPTSERISLHPSVNHPPIHILLPMRILLPFFLVVMLTLLPPSATHPLSLRTSSRITSDNEPEALGSKMSFVRLCAAFHSEACSPSADPPGPCQFQKTCKDVACDLKKPQSCAADPTASFCDGLQCDANVRQARHPLTMFANRMLAKKDVEDEGVQHVFNTQE